MVPATDNVALLARFKVSGAYQTANYMWASDRISSAGASAPAGSASASSIQIIEANVGNTTSDTLSGWGVLSSPADAVRPKIFSFTATFLNGVFYDERGSGTYTGSNAAVTGLQFLASSGNITSGEFKLYGFKKTV